MKEYKVIKREDILDNDIWNEIKAKESHHSHEIIITDKQQLRWKENNDVIFLLEKIDLNDLIFIFSILGIDKNNEIYRNLYRNMGYSLYGYWEVFYWDANNENYANYNPVTLYENNTIYYCEEFLEEEFTQNGYKFTYLGHNIFTEKYCYLKEKI